MTDYFYFRCSTDLQDATRQKEAALRNGILEKNIYGDYITGVSNYGDRPEYQKLVSKLQPNDCVWAEDLTRFGRSMVQMLVEINNLIEQKIHIKTLDGRLSTKDMNEEVVRLIVGVMGYAAEMELKNIKRRTAEGRAVAMNRGVKFGKKRKYDKHQIAEIMKKRELGEGYGTIGRSMGMSRATVASIVKREKVAV